MCPLSAGAAPVSRTGNYQIFELAGFFIPPEPLLTPDFAAFIQAHL
jgi:hypothetical protein